jgi:deoxycytidylate deaminase
MTPEQKIMQEAFDKAKYSPCLKKKVGAALTDSSCSVVLSTGYGGAEVPCEKCVRKEYEWSQDGCWSVHAEMRCLFNYFEKYRQFHMELKHGVMFTTHGPCDGCIKYMNYFGIPKMIYSVYYHNDYSKWKGLIEIYRLEEDGNLIREV